MTEESIVQDILDAYSRIQQAHAQARWAIDHYFDDLHDEYARKLDEIQASFYTQAGSAGEHSMDDAGVAFRRIVAGWSDPAWEQYSPTTQAPAPSAIRAGKLALDSDSRLDLPALAGLAGRGHLFLLADEPQVRIAVEMLRAIALRAVLCAPPGSVRLRLLDPAGLGANLSLFLRLPIELRGAAAHSKPDEMEQALNELRTHVESVLQTRLQNIYANVEEYNARSGAPAIAYHLLVVAGFPTGFTDRMAEQLVAIARHGPAAGVYVAAYVQRDQGLPRDFELSSLTAGGTTFSWSDSGLVEWTDEELGAYPLEPEPAPPAETVSSWLDAVTSAVKKAEVSLGFDRLAVRGDEWQGSALEGLDIPIGITGAGEPWNLSLGKGVVHHGLIGGMTQSGKTNLLHVIITQLALKYAPEEIELFLIDFKEGVEFQHYLTRRLPHLRVIALESEREFGLSVLRRLAGEIDRRGSLFRELSVSRYSDYRRAATAHLPRLVLLMDEFQVMFQEDDRMSQDAARLLEDVARRGAAFGVHVLLASQSPSGGPHTGHRIYDQMALRIALKCQTPRDAQAILGEGNDGASHLNQPGEAVYNDDRGLKEKNVALRVAFLPSEQRVAYLERIEALGLQANYPNPVSFAGRTLAKLEEDELMTRALAQSVSANPSALQLWQGQPLEIKSTTVAVIERYARSNLLIAGGDEEQARGLLMAAVLSVAVQLAPGQAGFTIADFARPDSASAAFWQPLASDGHADSGLPHEVRVAGPRQVGAELDRLSAELEERLAGATASCSEFFVVVGLHRWRELRPEPDRPYEPSPTAKKLMRLADEGPEVGIHLITWTDGSTTFERIRRGAASSFDLRVALRLAEKDSNDLLATNLAAHLADNRAYFRHEDWEMGRLEKFKPFAAPSAEFLRHVLENLRERSRSAT